MNKRIYGFGVRESIGERGQPMYVPSLKLYGKSCEKFSNPAPKYIHDYLSCVE